jgi:hypothetical protein
VEVTGLAVDDLADVLDGLEADGLVSVDEDDTVHIVD